MTEKTSVPLVIPPRTWRVWAIAIVSLITITRVLALQASQLELLPDEAQYWSWSRELAVGYFTKPPLIAWLIRLTTEIAGNAEWAIRLAAPLFHWGTAMIVLELGSRLFGPRAGFWSAVLYATLPGVSFSALIISTDVPLLFFWALALLALWDLLERPGWRSAILLGVAIGLGLNSKYAMVYFLLGMAVLYAIGPRAAFRAAGRQLALAGGIALLLIAPNLIWNAQNGWATLSHTAANADWWSKNGQGSGHLEPALEFAAAQFGVFGPVLLTALFVRAARAQRPGNTPAETYLLAFAIPVLLLMLAQSLISRAHANWAAVAYVSGVVAMVGWLERIGRAWPIAASFVLHLVAMIVYTTLFAGAITVRPPKEVDPFHEMRGWRNLAELVWGKLASLPPGTSLAADDREVMAELDYYTRGRNFPLVMAVGNGPPGNQYELKHPVDAETGQHVLLVSRDKDRTDILNRFETHEMIEEWSIRAGIGRSRHFYVFTLEGLRS